MTPHLLRFCRRQFFFLIIIDDLVQIDIAAVAPGHHFAGLARPPPVSTALVFYRPGFASVGHHSNFFCSCSSSAFLRVSRSAAQPASTNAASVNRDKTLAHANSFLICSPCVETHPIYPLRWGLLYDLTPIYPLKIGGTYEFTPDSPDKIGNV